MATRVLGVAAMGGPATQVVERIVALEEMGIPAAWLTTGGAGPDGLTIFAAAAVRTRRILLGTAITPTWPRHPVTAVQQVQVLASLAPGRFRFGVGPSHRPIMEGVFGARFRAPLSNMREYITIVRTLLREGRVEFQGQHYRASASIPHPCPDVPVLGAALRPRAFRLCGQVADGAISWLCPARYLEEVALPALEEGAREAGRPRPSLVAHTPVLVAEDEAQVRMAVQAQLGGYLRLPFYVEMFRQAGFPEASQGRWSPAMVEAVVLWGDEERVAQGLHRLFALGADEVIAAPLMADQATYNRTLSLLARVARGL